MVFCNVIMSSMGRGKKRVFDVKEGVEFLNNLFTERPHLSLVIPLFLVVWGIEKWFFSLSNWVFLAVAVWATIQYGGYQRRLAVEDLNKKWKQIVLHSMPETPLEHCEWLNKLLMEIWPHYMSPKLSFRFTSVVERRLKHRTPKLIEKIELLEFSLGATAPVLGVNGTRWSTKGDQRILRLGFDWDSIEISILLLAKLGKPLMGTARIVVNSIHVKGDLMLMPILDGRALLYSFVTTPEVRIGVAFGSGGSQSLPATELPGVSSWLVKLISDTLVKTMVEPRRRCLFLPPVDLYKKAVGGILHVTVASGSKLSRCNLKGSPSRSNTNSTVDFCVDDQPNNKDLRTFVEVEVEELTRKTVAQPGSHPVWNSTFNMVLHDDAGLVKFNLYECSPGSVKYDYLTSCEVKMRYNADDSTIFWAIGAQSSVIAKHAEFSGKEIEMTIPFEGVNSGEVIQKTRTVSHVSDPTWNQKFEFDEIGDGEYLISSRGSLANGWVEVVLIEAKDLVAADLRGTSDPYVRVQYGNSKRKTKIMYKTLHPQWHQTFEFPDNGSPLELHVKDHNALLPTSSIGDCVVEYQRLPPNQLFDKWIPLQNVKKGEIHVQVTRKLPESPKKSQEFESSAVKARQQISKQMNQMMVKFQSLIDDRNLEELSSLATELQSLHDTREEHMLQLETEQMLLLNKINELGQEIYNCQSPNLNRRPTFP
ncbi:hypothetical protein Leryth_006119 [Lithospermum erythrorhizon]|nr:hypothetical protein Leryth_006119 [Lithospermum erythrorhizon]